MAQPAPQAPPPYLPVPPYAAPPPPPKKSRTALYAVVAVVVAVLVVVIALAASGAFSPKSSPPTLKLSPDTTNLINTQSQTFGPGTTGAVVVRFDVPTLGGSWVNGTFTITGCTSIGNYCLANAWLFTPSAWSNYEHGGTVTGECLTQEIGGNCQSEQTIQIASGDLLSSYEAQSRSCPTSRTQIQIASGDLLSSYGGQTLDLCLWSNATTESQTFSADVNFNFFSGSAQ
jgi:hypothetical protein